MIPKRLATTWKELKALLAAGRAEEAADLLSVFGSAPAELVRTMHDEIVAVIEHALFAARREELYALFEKGPCFPLHRPSWKTTIVARKGTKTRYVRDDSDT